MAEFQARLSNRDLLFGREGLARMLNSAPEASDFFVRSGLVPIVSIHGRYERLRDTPLSEAEAMSLQNWAYGGAAGEVQEGRLKTLAGNDPEVFALEMPEVGRFRGIFVKDGADANRSKIEVTLRRIRSEPWTVEEASPPPGFLAACHLTQGVVLVTGPTGSGKSSLLSAALRDKLEVGNSRLVTAEQPIEFVYGGVNPNGPPVTQVLVGSRGGVSSFASAISSFLRMAPRDILVGETRDRETAEAVAWAAQSGHMVFSTMHPGSVVELFSYWMRLFPQEGRERAMADLANSLKYVVAQRLVRSIDGKRVPIREWVDFSKLDSLELTERLCSAGARLVNEVHQILHESGSPFSVSAQDVVSRGLVAEESVAEFLV